MGSGEPMWEVVCGALAVQCLRTDATLFVWVVLCTLLVLLYLPDDLLDESPTSSTKVSASRVDKPVVEPKTTEPVANPKPVDETTTVEACAMARRDPSLVPSKESRRRLMEDCLKSMQAGRQFARTRT